MPSASLAITQILLAKHLLKYRPPYPTEIPAQSAAETIILLALFFDCLILWCTNSPCCSKFKVVVYIFTAFQKTCSCPLPLFLTKPDSPSTTPKSVFSSILPLTFREGSKQPFAQSLSRAREEDWQENNNPSPHLLSNGTFNNCSLRPLNVDRKKHALIAGKLEEKTRGGKNIWEELHVGSGYPRS